TTLIGRMLDAAGRKVMVGGNIGTPLSAQVGQSTSDTLHVVETSSFQLETTTTFHPWIAMWLNFADDHLDRHPTVDAYAAAKARIFANQDRDDWAVLKDRKSTRLNSSHLGISYAVFCLKKKKKTTKDKINKQFNVNIIC